MVKLPMKCTLDKLKVIAVWRLRTNLTSVLIRNLVWFWVLSFQVLWRGYSNNMIKWYD